MYAGTKITPQHEIAELRPYPAHRRPQATSGEANPVTLSNDVGVPKKELGEQ